jgi:putative ABC transport system permease protein
VVISITFLISFLGLIEGYNKAIMKDINNLGVHLLAIPKGCPYEATALIMHGGIIPNYLDESVIPKISSLPNIYDYYAMMMGVLPSKELPESTDIIYGVTDGVFNLKKNWEVSKNLFLNETGAVIGKRKALSFGVNEGDYIKLGNNGNKYKVLYVIPETGTEDDNIIFLPLKNAQDVLNVSGKITGVAISLKDITKLKETSDEIEKIKDVQVVTMNDVLSVVMGYIRIVRALLLGIVIITVLVSGIQILNSTLIAVLEQIREIGVFKAIGATGRQIASFIFIQSFLVSLIGSLFAILVSYIFAPILNIITKSFIPSPPAGSIISLTPSILLYGVLFSIIVGFISGIYPAYKASSLIPSEVIRMDVLV